MAVRAIPQPDGSVKYVDDVGSIYTPDEISNIPHLSTFDKIGNFLTNLPGMHGVTGTPDEQKALAQSLYNTYDAYSGGSADNNALTEEAGRILNTDPKTFLGAESDLQAAAQYKAKIIAQSPGDWDQFVVDYPKTSKYLSDSSNMAISHDDLDNLGNQESMLSVMGNAYQLNTLSQERASLGNKLLLSLNGIDSLSPEDRNKLDNLNAQIETLQKKMPKSTWSVPGVLAGIAGMVPSIQEGVKYGAYGAVTGAGIGSLAAGVGAAPGALAGLSQGFRLGFAKDFTTSTTGNLYLDQLQKGTNPTDAAKGAAVSGLGTAALSTLQIGKLINLPERVKSNLANLGINVLEQSAIGSGFTASEIAGNKVSEGKALNWGTQDLQQIAEGGVNMAPLALAMTLPGHAYIGLKQIGDVVDQSKTYQRAPEVMAEKINTEVEGTPLENVSIPGQELFDYIQNVAEENPKEAQEIIERLNVDPQEIKEAIATGGDVDVKLGNFETLSKEHRESLLETVKIGDQPSKKEIDEMYKESPESVMQEQPLVENKVSEEQSTMAKDIGLDENKDYKQVEEESKSHVDDVIKNYDKAENNPVFIKSLDDHMESVKKIVDSQINSEPLYQASDKLSFDLQMFGSKLKNVKDVAKKYISGSLDDKQKLYVDTVAEQHGFSSGNELVKKIINNRLKDDEVKTRLSYAAEQFKKQELGDRSVIDSETKISEANVKKAAIEANALSGLSRGEHITAKRAQTEAEVNKRWADAEKDFMVKLEKAKGQEQINKLKEQLSETKKQHKDEINALKNSYKEADKQRITEEKQSAKENKRAQTEEWKSAKEWLKAEDVSQRLARQSAVNVTTAIKYAKSVLGDKPVKDAINYSKYMKQARDSAKKSEKEYRAGKYEEAARWKNTEMVNHAMALESMKINKDFNKQEKYLKDTSKKRIDLFKTNENFTQVGALLDRFGMGRKDYRPATKTENIRQWSDRMDEMLGSVNIPAWIYDETIRKGYKDLTLSQLKDVTDALKNIQKVANQEKISIAVNKGESLDKLIQTQMSEMAKKETKYIPKMEPGRFEKTKQTLSNFYYQLQTFSTVISRLQGWKTFGSLEDFWIRPVHERANLESNRLNVFKTELEKVWNVYSKKERSRMNNDKIFYDEIGDSWTKNRLMAMALNLGNKGNSDKLFGTMPVGVDPSKTWDEQAVRNLLSKNLDSRDWKTVQNIWNLVNSVWPDLAKFHAEMTGFEPKKVENTPFDVSLPNGEVVHMDGGYYPLARDTKSTLIAAAREDANSPLYKDQNPAWKATTAQGYTKERTSLQYALSLDVSLINKHMVDVIHDLYFRDLVSDFRRTLNNQDFQNMVKSKTGPEGLRSFQEYVNTVASGETYRDAGFKGLESVVDYFRKAGTKAAISLRVGVITQNLANIVLYPKAVEGFGYFDTTMGLIRHGLFDYVPKSAFNWSAAKKVRDEIYNISPYMRDRRKTPDYSLNDLQTNLFNNGLFIKNRSLSEFSVGLLSGSDDLTAVPMWKQAYEKKLAETGDQKDAAYYADSLIKSVNGSGRKYDVAPIVRSSKVIDKVMSSFYSFMNTEFNRWVKEVNIAGESIVNKPRFIGFVASRMVVFTILSDLLAGKGPEDKEDPVSYYAGLMASYPLQMVPILRDVAPVVIDGVLGLHSYGYRQPIALSELENIVTAGSKVGSYINNKGKGKNKVNEQDIIESLSKAASYGTGYPDQLNAWFFNAYDYLNNSMDPDLQDIFKRRPKKERKN
jgi:hypothetical protein